MSKLNVIWCQWWNEELQEPDGVMRCIGECETRREAGELINDALLSAFIEGWGDGVIALTDDQGELLELIPGELQEALV